VHLHARDDVGGQPADQRSTQVALGEDDDPTPSEAVYLELLAALAQHQDVRTDVAVDVIAGTSAGGINGV
jgi:hypothetical protein